MHEVLPPSELARRLPQFVIDPTWIGLLERDAGFVVPEAAVTAMASVARSLGADVHEHEQVLEWTAGSDGVVVRTSSNEYRAGRLVNCAGPWSAKVVADLGARLPISRFYGFPVVPGERGLKTGVHAPGVTTDPDLVSRTGTSEDETLWREGLRRHLPAADGRTLAQVICLYDNSPDGHFILDRHPHHANVVVACGFSGHGFKFAPVIGEALADLTFEASSSLPIGFLGLDRFQRDRGRVS